MSDTRVYLIPKLNFCNTAVCFKCKMNVKAKIITENFDMSKHKCGSFRDCD